MMVKYKNLNNYLNNMKYLLLAILFISLLSSVDAFTQQSEMKPAQLNQPYTIIQPCADATWINFSLSNSNGLVVTNTAMVNNGSGSFIYTYTPNILGRTDFTGISDGCDKTFATYFEVTNNGAIQSTAQGIGSMIFMVLMLSLTVIFGYLGWKFLNNDILFALGCFFTVLCLILVVYNVWLAYEFKLNYTGSSPDAGIPETIFYIFMTVLTAGLLVGFFMLFTKWKVIKEKFKNAKTLKDEEDKDDLV